jgi:hypothetical protein
MVNLLAGDKARLSTKVARKAALLYYQIVEAVRGGTLYDFGAELK